MSRYDSYKKKAMELVCGDLDIEFYFDVKFDAFLFLQWK